MNRDSNPGDPLFAPLQVGAWSLPNRIVMAPLTRSRSRQPGNVPWELNAEYYAQRATAGLIIAEATQISPQGRGYFGAPGIHSAEQVAGWHLVTDAVHAVGGRIVLQLWHVGRISHPSLQPDGQLPVAPSARRPASRTYIDATGTRVELPTPRALETEEIPGIVADYAAAARNAREAGFDGVEIHGANGYLLDQFTRDGTNQRTDDYGGSLENRLRFPRMVAEAVSEVWGPDRVGYRVSPASNHADLIDSEAATTFGRLAEHLSSIGLAYIHVLEAIVEGVREPETMRTVRTAFNGVYIGNNDYTPAIARDRVAAGDVDAVAFGRAFIANPDLPARIAVGAPLAEPDRATFYLGDARGYTDYPALTVDEATP